MLQAAPSTALVNAVVPTALYVPMDALSYSVHGTCFTGKIQIGWIGQLIERPKLFVLHVDGKYKLHHQNCILLTLGTLGQVEASFWACFEGFRFKAHFDRFKL